MQSHEERRQTEAVREFIQFIGQKLSRCAQSFEHETELNRNECAVLLILAQKGPAVVKEIAGCMQEVSQSTLTRLLDRLEHKQYIERQLDPNDRRSFIISPTSKAESLAGLFPQRLDLIAEQMLNCLTPEQRVTLLELFGQIRASMHEQDANEEGDKE